jgi:hypothetical protein
MTDDDLDELERLAAAATPGPWTAPIRQEDDSGNIEWWVGFQPLESRPGQYSRDSTVLSYEDAAFITAARTAVPDLCREVRRLRAALKRIAEWDCLNPPDPSLCCDHPWLRRLVDSALNPSAAPNAEKLF